MQGRHSCILSGSAAVWDAVIVMVEKDAFPPPPLLTFWSGGGGGGILESASKCALYFKKCVLVDCFREAEESERADGNNSEGSAGQH